MISLSRTEAESCLLELVCLVAALGRSVFVAFFVVLVRLTTSLGDSDVVVSLDFLDTLVLFVACFFCFCASCNFLVVLVLFAAGFFCFCDCLIVSFQPICRLYSKHTANTWRMGNGT